MLRIGYIYVAYRNLCDKQLLSTDPPVCWFCGGPHCSTACEEPVVFQGKAVLRHLFRRFDTEEWDETTFSTDAFEELARETDAGPPESASGGGGVDVLVTKDRDGEDGERGRCDVWFTHGPPAYRSGVWGVGHSNMLSLFGDLEPDEQPKEIQDKPGGKEGWPIEATLYLKLKKGLNQ